MRHEKRRVRVGVEKESLFKINIFASIAKPINSVSSFLLSLTFEGETFLRIFVEVVFVEFNGNLGLRNDKKSIFSPL